MLILLLHLFYFVLFSTIPLVSIERNFFEMENFEITRKTNFAMLQHIFSARIIDDFVMIFKFSS